jgi:hypothetical protein
MRKKKIIITCLLNLGGKKHKKKESKFELQFLAKISKLLKAIA